MILREIDLQPCHEPSAGRVHAATRMSMALKLSLVSSRGADASAPGTESGAYYTAGLGWGPRAARHTLDVDVPGTLERAGM